MAQRHEIVRLNDGDTLALDAQLVRRSIGGRTFTMYGYNGQYPGPLLKVKQRSTVVVNFRNRIDFPSSVHWHGLRLENRFDGVPGVTQEPVAPGGSFQYRVHFPDPGIYWYHPHVKEDVTQNLGLYGNILVSASDPSYLPPVNDEQMLMLDDLLFADGGLVPYGLDTIR